MKVSRISMSLPSELLSSFDDSLKRFGYEDRSKALQMAIRSFIGEHEWTREEEGEGSGAVVLIYDPEVRRLESVLTELQHHYPDVVKSVMHVHLDKHDCLQVIAVKGRSKGIKQFAQEIAKQRGVKQLKLAYLKST